MFLGINLIWSNEKIQFILYGKRNSASTWTPISSLMGWVGLLEENPSNKENIYFNEDDLNKLENILWFNKIGSMPKFSEFNLIEVIEDVINYYKSKLPKSSKTEINHNFKIKIY